MTKKVKISFLIVVWSIVAIQIYVNYQEKTQNESQAITAFSVVGEGKQDESISGYGYFGTMEISENAKKNMLENLAYKLGITDGYTFTNGNGDDFEKKVLVKEGKYATTTLQIISMPGNNTEPEQYIVIDIKTKEKIENAAALYQKVKRIYEEIGVEGQVSLEVAVEKQGNCIMDGGGNLVGDIFAVMDAKEIDAVMEDGIFTVYGYTKAEDSYLQWDDKKVNIQIVMSYDEKEDKTYVKIGVPIVNTSY